MQNLELYIDGTKVDLFDFESIKLVEVIQDIKDIGNIFTDYSQEFKLPPSKVNNRLFKRYYDYRIDNTFDARIRHDAIIKINGLDFKFGKIRLTGVSMENNRVYSYNVGFFGGISDLNDLLGKSQLDTLSYLDNFNHIYESALIQKGLEVGLGLVGGSMVESTQRDVVYTMMSHTDQLYYDSSGTPTDNTIKPPSKNLFNDGITDNGLEYTDLKPSIRLNHIITAIEASYPKIVFDKTFFDSPAFNDAYLLLHRTKGPMSPAKGLKTYSLSMLDWKMNLQIPSDSATYRLETYNNGNKDAKSYVVKWTVEPDSIQGAYKMTIKDLVSGNNVGFADNLDGDYTMSVLLSSNDIQYWDLVFTIETDGGFTLFDTNLSVQEDIRTNIGPEKEIYEFTSPQAPAQESMIGTVFIKEQIPKMEIIKFLTSIFKTFNLTAELNKDGIIEVMPLDDYYSKGNTYDISNYVDSSSSTVDRANIYNLIEYKYEEPKTFASKNREAILNERFGDLKYDGGATFDGGKYEVKVGFEHMLFERMTDQNTPLDTTPIQWGWLVDDNESTVLTAPVIHYSVNTPINTASYKIGWKGSPSVRIETYNRPSNANSDGSQSLNFNAEIEEFSGVINQNSLFNNYYAKFVSNMFNIRTRLLKIKATLPLNILLKHTLADTIVINSKQYNINSIDVNLMTREADLELINDVEAELGLPPVIPSGLTVDSRTVNTITTEWNINSDNRTVSYRVYLDGILDGEVDFNAITPPTYTYTGLQTGIDYTLTVTSVSANGIESEHSAPVVTTTNDTDTTIPTVPTALAKVSSTPLSINISWTASTDNVGVTGYEVWVDDSYRESVGAVTSHNIESLASDTSFDIKLKAFDAAGNKSALSTALIASTDEIIDVIPPSIPYNVRATSRTTSILNMEWDNSTDNVGVSYYNVYVDGLFEDISFSNFYSITGLSSGTQYTINISAIDDAGNESALSINRKETTL